MATTASVFFSRIRTDYPQAGRDNDSQGFRDNFRNIFNAFSATNADIESLQLNSVTLGGNNDFGYNAIKKATLQSSVTLVNDNGIISSGNTDVDYRNSNYQIYEVSPGLTTFFVTNWPNPPAAISSVASELKLKLVPQTTATVNFGGNVIAVGALALPAIITTTTFFELWTDDEGASIYAYKKG